MYLELIQKLKNSDLTQKDLNILIEKCYKIAIHYFRFARSRIYKVLADDLKIEDIAIDAITPLFASGNENPLSIFIAAVTSWDKAIESENDALYFMNKLIAKRVEQHTCQLYREADPFFSKILDSINYLIKRDGYNKINYLGIVYILDKDIADNAISPLLKEDLQNINSEIFLRKKYLLSALFGIGSFNAIPLNALVYRIKELETGDYLRGERTTDFEETIIHVEELTKKGLDAAVSKLKISYFQKNKLNEFETQAFELSLQDMANDLKDGGINPGLYDYLSIYISGLSKEIYQERYHNILEYLLKIMKKIIAEGLAD